MGETPPGMVFVWESEAGKEAAGGEIVLDGRGGIFIGLIHLN